MAICWKSDKSFFVVVIVVVDVVCVDNTGSGKARLTLFLPHPPTLRLSAVIKMNGWTDKLVLVVVFLFFVVVATKPTTPFILFAWGPSMFLTYWSGRSAAGYNAI